MSRPDTPIDAYKAIIDQLISETRHIGSSSLVSEESLFSKAPAHQEYNELIRSLTPEQRTLLSRMLQTERDGTIHDVLAMLTWWISAREVSLSYRGETMPTELSGMGLHGDYIGRLDGWKWPDSGSKLQA